MQGRVRGSWTAASSSAAAAEVASVPHCKVIPLNPLLSGSESETSELVNARYPYGLADDSLEEWAMLSAAAAAAAAAGDSDAHSRFSPTRTANPMLRKNQYWV